jgi:hypothetical protein
VVVGGLACGDVDFTNVNTCESIISHAFNHCSSITGLTIGSNISNIGQSAFRGCSSLKRVNLSAASELNSISTLAFADDTHLENVVLSKNIQKLGDSTFQNCTNLVKVETELCVNLNIIGTSCFADCISLIQFVCPRSVTYIGSYAFTGCSSLRYVTLLSDYFDELGANIFANCISLEKDGSYLMFVNIEDPNILEGVISPAGIFDAIIPYQVYISDITNVND